MLSCRDSVILHDGHHQEYGVPGQKSTRGRRNQWIVRQLEYPTLGTELKFWVKEMFNWEVMRLGVLLAGGGSGLENPDEDMRYYGKGQAFVELPKVTRGMEGYRSCLFGPGAWSFPPEMTMALQKEEDDGYWLMVSLGRPTWVEAVVLQGPGREQPGWTVTEFLVDGLDASSTWWSAWKFGAERPEDLRHLPVSEKMYRGMMKLRKMSSGGDLGEHGEKKVTVGGAGSAQGSTTAGGEKAEGDAAPGEHGFGSLLVGRREQGTETAIGEQQDQRGEDAAEPPARGDDQDASSDDDDGGFSLWGEDAASSAPELPPQYHYLLDEDHDYDEEEAASIEDRMLRSTQRRATLSSLVELVQGTSKHLTSAQLRHRTGLLQNLAESVAPKIDPGRIFKREETKNDIPTYHPFSDAIQAKLLKITPRKWLHPRGSPQRLGLRPGLRVGVVTTSFVCQCRSPYGRAVTGHECQKANKSKKKSACGSCHKEGYVVNKDGTNCVLKQGLKEPVESAGQIVKEAEEAAKGS